MEYRVISLKDAWLIKVIGPLNRKAIFSVSTFIKPFLNGSSANIILDIDGLEDEKEIAFHLGLVNAFRKEVDQAGGKFTLSTERSRLKKYLKNIRLDKLFNISDPKIYAE